MSFFAHESSFVDYGSLIGDGTKIWHFCHIFGGAEIGRDCVIGQGCSISSKVKIGDGCRLQNGISVYDGVTLEDGVFCGPHMVFTNVVNPRSFVSRKDEFKPTVVRKGASIGAGAVIVCGVEIGQYSFIGAGSIVTKNVLPYSLVYGNPAKNHGWMSRLGNKMEFIDNQFIDEDGTRYHLDHGVAIVERKI